MNIKKNIPNTITSLNLLGGLGAIICGSHGVEQWWCGLSAWQWGALFVAMAAVADFCDGLSARSLRAYSPMGRELDSLCDMVSFGVAPAIIMYGLLETLGSPEWLGWCMVAVPLGGAMRLARFNVEAGSTGPDFRGLPIPANAIFWIGYAAAVASMKYASPPVTVAAVVITALLMVSNVGMFSLKLTRMELKSAWPQYSLVVAAVVFVVSLGVEGLAWLIAYYVCLSVACRKKIRR